MTKQKIEIEIDVPEGCEFDGMEEVCTNKPVLVPRFKKVKPAKQIIDLSCIVGSGIDCETSDEKE